MKTTASFVLSLTLGLCLFAQESEKVVNIRDLPPAERRARIYKHTGGFVIQPGSQKGRIAILNAQKRVVSSELKPCCTFVAQKLGFKATVEDIEPITFSTALQAKQNAKAEIAVFLVDDPALPISVVAYEEHWGIVNVAKLADGADKVQLFGRVNVETLRVMALASGGGDSQYHNSAMKCIAKPADLDGAPSDLPFDVMNRMIVTGHALGLTAENRSTYRNACREGWAPQPTNDVQKVIWDEVHAIPTKPITIEKK